jgi:hypothetical protein
MSKFVDSLLLKGRLRRHQRVDLLDDRLMADIGMPREQMRHVQPFLLGSMVARSG